MFHGHSCWPHLSRYTRWSACCLVEATPQPAFPLHRFHRCRFALRELSRPPSMKSFVFIEMLILYAEYYLEDLRVIIDRPHPRFAFYYL